MKKYGGSTAKRNRTAFGDRIGSALTGAGLGASLALAVCAALGLQGVTWTVYLCALCAGLLLAVICTWGIAAILAGGIAAAVETFRVLSGRAANGTAKMLFDGLLYSDLPASEVLLQYAVPVALALTVLLTVLCYAFARMQGGAVPALALALVTMLGCWYTTRVFLPVPAAFALAALAVMLARTSEGRMPWRRAAAMAVCAALIASLCVPPAGTTYAPLEEAAQKVRDLVNEYFRFTQPRTSYTVALDGWQPMGERLGGPADPRTDDVLEVRTDGDVLLRGSVRNTYTGYSWVQKGVGSRFVYLDPTKAALRGQVFRAGLADGSSAFRDADVSVRFLSGGTSALFVPELLEGIEAPLETAIYFNENGEVFYTRDAVAGDTYAAEGSVFAHGAALRELVRKNAGAQDERYEEIRKEYTALPEGIEDGVKAAARKAVGSAEDAYTAAENICAWLKSGGFTYKLDVLYPPEDRDFVSYFLLESKEGYCTYFASAMAVMARMAGLPARYIEGYAVDADPSGTTIVTGESAHAWVEVYFRGIGWVAFDPTPGVNGGGDGEGESGTGSEEPQNTPEPQPTPTPTPPPEPTDPPEEQTEPDTSPTDPPTQEPTPEPTREPDEDEDPPEPDRNREHKYLWLALLFVLLAVLLLLLMRREKKTRPQTAAKLEGADRMLVWYRAMLGALEIMHLEPRAGESPQAAAKRLTDTREGFERYGRFANAVAIYRYANGEPGESIFALAEQAYADILAQMTKRQRLQWYLRRVRRGIGNWRRIPD